MARHNEVILYGQVLNKPHIFTDNGKLVRGMLSITVMERPNYNPDGSKSRFRYDTPIILSLNEDIIKTMSELKQHDMIMVKGVLCSIRVNKSNYCTNCGEKNTIEGNAYYVNPLCLFRVENISDKEIEENNIKSEIIKGKNNLKERAEISNEIILIGNLCSNPEYYEENIDMINCKYQLAVNRKIRIMEDPDDKKTDYFIVQTYGNMAKDDFEFLQKGSSVFINGMLRTRNFERTFTCEHCGCQYTGNDNTTDIIPYSVEYLSNLKTDTN